jgi:hypothetical protein
LLTIRIICHGPRKPGSTKVYPCLDSGFFIDNGSGRILGKAEFKLSWGVQNGMKITLLNPLPSMQGAVIRSVSP